MSRIFTFHGSVAAARSFTSEDGEGIRNHLPDFTTLHVSGEMPTARREDHMKVFRQAPKAVMSNARCLTEGVDVPAVDMVAFISPRKSKVDIVQATGRAMRKSDETGKQFGYVMVPLFVEQAADESIEEALYRTGFDDIGDLLGAMREQDDVLTDIIRQMREDKGRAGGYDESRFSERVEVLGPSVSLETIRGAITAECLESLGVSWDEWFGKLLVFAEREGHCRVPHLYQTSDGYRLGQWVSGQRKIEDSLSAERKLRLEALPGWVWDAIAEKWEIGFRHLTEFSDREGHRQIPNNYQTADGYRFGQWIGEQRKHKNDLPQERRKRLDAVLGWLWDARTEQWELGFRQLTEFAEREGHCQVPQNYRTASGYLLGKWVTRQRSAKDDLSTERRKRLESVSSWVWCVHTEQWELGFRHLIDFLSREGHCRIPNNYQTIDGYRLGQWVGKQRAAKDDLSAERIERLEAVPGWLWDVLADQWEEGFRMLMEFAEREGHCRVQARYRTADGYCLGTWVCNQRTAKDELSIVRRKRLETVSGWEWIPFDERWEIGFRHLSEFAKCEGHCRIPQRYRTSEGFRLGEWIGKQRAAINDLPVERKERLEAVPGWVWDVLTEQWEIGFRHLTEFAEREGHCRVPANYRTINGYRLGTWVTNQRAVRISLPADRKERLEAVPGWVWNVFADRCEIGFRYLTEFIDREGHCRVPNSYQTSDGYCLGQWVSKQRRAKDSIPSERKERLEAIPGWAWRIKG